MASSRIDPLLIAPTLIVVGYVLGRILSWLKRRQIQARMRSLRSTTVLELEIVSNARLNAVLVAAVLSIALAMFVVAMAFIEWERAHRAEFGCSFIVLATGVMVALLLRPPSWVRVGRVVVDASALRLECGETQREISLSQPFDLLDGCVPLGQRSEVVVRASQNGVQIAFRYPLLVGDDALIEGIPVVARSGELLGAEARVVHERLRAISSSRNA